MRKKLFKLAVDIVNDHYISGWCFHRLRKKTPVEVFFYGDDKKIGGCIADRPRIDLLETALHPNGNCGFYFKMPANFKSAGFKTLSLGTGKTNTILKRYDISQIHSVVETSLPKIIFMHIPKTAGSSFNIFARSIFREDQVKIHVEPHALHDLVELQKSCAFLSGHLTAGEIKKSITGSSGIELYAIIRDPYRQLHSHMNWIKGIGINQQHNFFAKHHRDFQNLSLAMNDIDFKKPKELQKFVDTINGLGAHLFDNCQTRYFLDHKPAKINDANFTEAKDNINLFRDIGLTEQYDAFLEIFCQRYSIKMVKQEGKINKSTQTPLFDVNDAATREILAPLVATDRLLYDYVKNRFQNSAQ